jgi:hypothetical protein
MKMVERPDRPIEQNEQNELKTCQLAAFLDPSQKRVRGEKA